MQMKNVYTVSQINGYIKNMFDQDYLLVKLYVKGEVSNCKYHNSGHLYFSLKDGEGTLSCVMFAGKRRGLSFPLENGQQVIVLGKISVYERNGSYQMYADEILNEGAGRQHEQFERLKRELEEMGMFSKEYKKPVPAYSRTIGIVTAPRGAAIQDIRNIASRRNPYAQLILYPAQVQGDGAVESIVRGIQALDAYGVDVLIVGRGGGPSEDLSAFNDEAVARAIFGCRTPVISAVGHEVDTTIADFVADRRASTPSEAAELAVADVRALLERMRSYRDSMELWMTHQIRQRREYLARCELRLSQKSPRGMLDGKRMRAADFETRLEAAMERILSQARSHTALYAERLEGLSPLKKLSQGYAYVTDEKGRCVTKTGQVKPGDALNIRVSDGAIHAVARDTASMGQSG